MKTHKLLFFICMLYTVYCILYTAQAHASGVAIGVYPPILQIDANPPSDIKAPVTLVNPGDDTVSVSIQTRPFTASTKANGVPRFLTPKEPIQGADADILKKVQLFDNGHVITGFTLAPKQKKQLVMHIGLPKGEPASDYYFALVFVASGTNGLPSTTDQDASQQNQNAALAQGGVAANVLLSIGLRSPPRATLNEFSAPSMVESGPIPFTVKLTNTGKNFLTPRGQIIITNMFGQRIGLVNLASVNILAGTSRYLPDSKHTNPLQHPVAVWPERFLVGPYKATITLVLSDSGPRITRTIYFLGLPLQLAATIVITIFLLLLIRSRIKARNS